MLCCIGEIAILVFGILAVVRGEFALSRKRVCRGGAARAVGIILIATPILAMASSFVLGLVYGVQVGMQAVQQGQQQPQINPAKVQEIQNTAIIV